VPRKDYFASEFVLRCDCAEPVRGWTKRSNFWHKTENRGGKGRATWTGKTAGVRERGRERINRERGMDDL
jgi:hypothetical protein